MMAQNRGKCTKFSTVFLAASKEIFHANNYLYFRTSLLKQKFHADSKNDCKESISILEGPNFFDLNLVKMTILEYRCLNLHGERWHKFMQVSKKSIDLSHVATFSF